MHTRFEVLKLQRMEQETRQKRKNLESSGNLITTVCYQYKEEGRTLIPSL